MPPEPRPLDLADFIRRYAQGESLDRIGQVHGVSGETVRVRLVDAGVRIRDRNEAPRPERVSVDMDALIPRYLAGESIKALSGNLGIGRRAITTRLERAGIPIRDRSEAMYTRMSRINSEERAQLTAAAHDAVRGKPKTEGFLVARALGVEKQGAKHGNVSPAELMLADMLQDRGILVTHQKAIGPYNADLATLSVAVEVLGGQWHRVKKHGKRLRYLLDGGWDVIFVWVNGIHYPLGRGAAEYIAAHREFRRRNPAAIRCYRVIRGDGQLVASGSADGDDIPDILPISDRPNVPPAEVPPGYCHCGCGRPTSGGRNHTTGASVLYVSGHNPPRHRNAS
jgi:very-short-patch-repair endonuclease